MALTSPPPAKGFLGHLGLELKPWGRAPAASAKGQEGGSVVGRVFGGNTASVTELWTLRLPLAGRGRTGAQDPRHPAPSAASVPGGP